MSTAEAKQEASSWSLSVKTVGAELSQQHIADFQINVSPDDSVKTLYDQIEGVTGLTASQQRLIYRGRLIGNSNGDSGDALAGDPDDDECRSRIKDIVGLQDGHTIHLIKRREHESEPNDGGNPVRTHGSSRSLESGNPSSATVLGTGSLLTALLGMSSLEDEDGTEEIDSRLWRPSRYGSRRRQNYRLTQDDLEVADPGSMESVRQGLLTLHTMLPPVQRSVARATPTDQWTPLDSSRTWYRGQWIDVRDTVNQWLEATIVDIVDPHEILPPQSEKGRDGGKTTLLRQPATDPAVGAGDLEGRRRLLLEPCLEGESDDEGGDSAGFRRRANNDGVQLLLIHYNGWPHRWDEWIRSDSERVRPFRVRTRHPATSSTASPSVQSPFSAAPPTYIRSEDEARDRESMLPELSRVLSSVNALLSQVASCSDPGTNGSRDHLPWGSTLQESDYGTTSSQDDDDDDSKPEAQSSPLNRQQLSALVPLLDRLGRVLIDAAPHIASLAATIPEDSQASRGRPIQATAIDSVPEHPTTLSGFLSLLGRDRRRRVNASDDAVHNTNTGGSHLTADGRRQSNESNSTAVLSTDGSTLSDRSHGVGDSVVGGEGVLHQAATPPGRGVDARSPRGILSTPVVAIDPDYTDYVGSIVNTTRGEVRSGPRGRRSHDDDPSSLLGSYLAAASLASILGGGDGSDANDGDNMHGIGRLLRERGAAGGGVDIHIHAVVTAPGMGPGLGGLALFGPTAGLATPAPVAVHTMGNNLFSGTRDRRTPASSLRLRTSVPHHHDDDDMGIFAELYSDNPDPVDPSLAPDDPRAAGAAGGSSSSAAGSAVTTSASSSSRLDDLSARLSSVVGRSDPVSLSSRGGFRRGLGPFSRSGGSTGGGDLRGITGSNNNGGRRPSMFGRLFRRNSANTGRH